MAALRSSRRTQWPPSSSSSSYENANSCCRVRALCRFCILFFLFFFEILSVRPLRSTSACARGSDSDSARKRACVRNGPKPTTETRRPEDNVYKTPRNSCAVFFFFFSIMSHDRRAALPYCRLVLFYRPRTRCERCRRDDQARISAWAREVRA